MGGGLCLMGELHWKGSWINMATQSSYIYIYIEIFVRQLESHVSNKTIALKSLPDGYLLCKRRIKMMTVSFSSS